MIRNNDQAVCGQMYCCRLVLGHLVIAVVSRGHQSEMGNPPLVQPNIAPPANPGFALIQRLGNARAALIP